MTGGITEALRIAQIADHYGLVVAPHFLPALFIHLAAAAPSVKWMEHFPLLEPLFDHPVDMDENGEITFSLHIPRILSGLRVFFQSAEQGTCPDECVSNLVDSVVQ